MHFIFIFAICTLIRIKYMIRAWASFFSSSLPHHWNREVSYTVKHDGVTFWNESLNNFQQFGIQRPNIHPQ